MKQDKLVRMIPALFDDRCANDILPDREAETLLFTFHHIIVLIKMGINENNDELFKCDLSRCFL